MCASAWSCGSARSAKRLSRASWSTRFSVASTPRSLPWPVGQTSGVIPAFPHVAREDVRRKVEAGDVVLIDARSPMAFALSHLPGAVNLTSRWVAERASWYIRDPDTEAIVYCARCDCRHASP